MGAQRSIGVVVLVIGLWPLAAVSGDGVLEINQACAVNTGCFLGGGAGPAAPDSAGFPVSIRRSGSYRLTSDLTVPDANTDAIEIFRAPDTTIDLNGFSIIGPSICTGTGESLSCSSTGSGSGIRELPTGTGEEFGVRVMNGSVRGMGSDGISLNHGATIEKVTAITNGNHGILCVHSCTVMHSKAIRNGGSGIVNATSSGPVPMGMSALYNVSSGNAGLGISGGKLLIGNLVKENGGRGVQGLGGYGDNVLDNNAGGNVNGFTSMGGNLCGTGVIFTTCP
jgi:hypothetical protein